MITIPKLSRVMVKLSNTTQRRVIIEELRKLNTHPTADELYQIVKSRLPRISLGTVYRNLELLADHGDILKLVHSEKQKRFDGDVKPHNHMRCSLCGSVEDIACRGLKDVCERLDDLVEKSQKLENYTIEFTGLCPHCEGAVQEEPSKPLT